MPLVRVTQPAVEPLTVAEAGDFLRVAGQDDALLVASMISAARDMIERFTARAMITQQWKLILPSWGHRETYHNSGGRFVFPYYPQAIGRVTCMQEIELPRTPLQSIDSVKYYDEVGTLQTLDTAVYLMKPSGEAEPGALVLADGQSFPILARRPDAVQITFKAGYGDTADSIPPSLIHGVRFAVSHYYDMRQPVVIERATVDEIPFTVRSIIESFRVDFVA